MLGRWSIIVRSKKGLLIEVGEGEAEGEEEGEGGEIGWIKIECWIEDDLKTIELDEWFRMMLMSC